MGRVDVTRSLAAAHNTSHNCWRASSSRSLQLTLHDIHTVDAACFGCCALLSPRACYFPSGGRKDRHTHAHTGAISHGSLLTYAGAARSTPHTAHAHARAQVRILHGSLLTYASGTIHDMMRTGVEFARFPLNGVRYLHHDMITAGVEFAGTLSDFLRGDLQRKYPSLMRYVKVTLCQVCVMGFTCLLAESACRMWGVVSLLLGG